MATDVILDSASQQAPGKADGEESLVKAPTGADPLLAATAVPEPSESASAPSQATPQDSFLDAASRRRSERSAQRNKRGHEVLLHVYDLDSWTQRLNEMFLKGIALGAFHCGLEVLGDEWYFAFGETSDTGVVWSVPRKHPVHLYRETISMGESPLTENEIRSVIMDQMVKWPEDSYHPIMRNCATFAQCLAAELQAPEPFPDWVRGAADAGKSVVLFPIADYGWEWLKWWNKSPPEDTSAPNAENDTTGNSNSLPPDHQGYSINSSEVRPTPHS